MNEIIIFTQRGMLTVLFATAEAVDSSSNAAKAFNVHFISHGSLHKEMRPEEIVKPDYFYAGFDE